MTLLFVDGFDHYNTDQIPDKWDSSASLVYIGSTYKRIEGQGGRLASSSSTFRKHLATPIDTVYVGVAWRYSASGTPTYHSNYPCFRFQDENGVAQINIYPTPAYAFQVRDSGASILGTSPDATFRSYRWHYLEIKVTISDTVGEVTMKIDEVQVLNLTNQDTKNVSDYIGRISFGSVYNSYELWIDDVYIDDAQFHGNCQIKTFMPDADGNSADFTRSEGSNDFECVDETPSNEDTDYISSDTLNHKSIFGITTGALATVKGIQVNNHCRIDEAGARNIKAICRSNGADYQGAESDALATEFELEQEIWELDPDDSGAWTQTKLEAAEFGLEITT